MPNDTPRTPDGASQGAEMSVAYHASIAVRHFAAKIGKAYQVIALLNHMWSCAPSPWIAEPKLFFAASRLEWLIASRSGRCDALRKLIKIGAIKKVSRPTRSGVAYVLLRPDVWQLAPELQVLLTDPSARDFLYHPEVQLRLDADAPGLPKQAKPRYRDGPKVPRKEITEYLRPLKLAPKIKLSWPKLAWMLEKINGLTPGAVRFTKSAKDVHAFGAWLVTIKIKQAEIRPLFMLLKVARPERPTGNVLRYVFEADTDEKAEYLRCVLVDLRPRLQAAEGDET